MEVQRWWGDSITIMNYSRNIPFCSHVLTKWDRQKMSSSNVFEILNKERKIHDSLSREFFFLIFRIHLFNHMHSLSVCLLSIPWIYSFKILKILKDEWKLNTIVLNRVQKTCKESLRKKQTRRCLKKFRNKL